MRAVRKKHVLIFLEPFFLKNCFFAKPCLYEFYKISAQKKMKPEKCLFLQSRASLSFMRAVRKKHFLEPEKFFFFAKPCLYKFYKVSAQKK